MPVSTLATYMRLVVVCCLFPGTCMVIDDGIARCNQVGVDGVGDGACSGRDSGAGGDMRSRRVEKRRPRVARGRAEQGKIRSGDGVGEHGITGRRRDRRQGGRDVSELANIDLRRREAESKQRM